jgi:PAS domain S-box-containing protein
MSTSNNQSPYLPHLSVEREQALLAQLGAGTDPGLLTLILAAAPVAIVMVNGAGTILYANPKLGELFDYAPDELLGRPIELLIPERFRADHLEHRRRYVSNPHMRPMGSGLDLAGRRKDGTEFPIEAGLSFIEAGDDLLVMSSIADTTRRKQTEEVLERRVEERTRELERRREVADGLRDILTVLNSNQPLEVILNHIAAQACRLLHADASAICRTSEEPGPLVVQASFGLPHGLIHTHVADTEGEGAPQFDGFDTLFGAIMAEASPPRTGPAVVWSQEGVRISSDGARPAHADAAPVLMDTGYQAVLTVPLVIKEEVYGSLLLYYLESRRFSAEEIELAYTVGDQTALAIENARLRTQVERTAVAAERSRIARDLHDSVTQTLFSASIISEVLPRLWVRNRDEAERRLEELRQLTRGALAEMRTLLLELRPATLNEVELSELLRQLTEAITGRARVPIALEVQIDQPLPPDVKVAFFHIAQEALNNVAKHARATQASLELRCSGDHVQMSVRDDGRGFVLEKVTPEHLGVSIMHERAEAIGAHLQIDSHLERGTEVTIRWPA